MWSINSQQSNASVHWVALKDTGVKVSWEMTWLTFQHFLFHAQQHRRRIQIQTHLIYSSMSPPSGDQYLTCVVCTDLLAPLSPSWYLTSCSSLVIASWDRARTDTSRCGRSPAPQVQRETAFLWGGFPAWCGCLLVLGTPVHQRLQEK